MLLPLSFSFAIVLPKDGKYRVNGKVKNLKSLGKNHIESASNKVHGGNTATAETLA